MKNPNDTIGNQLVM